MKKYIGVLFILGFSIGLKAQLVNNGASIVIENGASLVVETDVNNLSGASIDIQGSGILNVKGNLTNAGTMTMGDDSKIIFSGANSATVTSGGATFTNVEMDKDAQDITLADAMTISQDINFIGDDNKLVLEAHTLTLEKDATVSSVDDNEFIVADAAGVVAKKMDATSVFTYPIGTGDNRYTPLTVDVTAGIFPLTLNVNTASMKQPNLPVEATDYINRYWNVDADNSMNFAASLSGIYTAADIQTGANTANIYGVHYDEAAWSYSNAGLGSNMITGDITKNGDFTGSNKFGIVSIKAILDGPYDGTEMTTTLNSQNLLPTTSPYGGGETVSSDFFANNTDVVDWIELEARNATTPTNVEGTGIGFIKSDGTIVGLDGVSNPLLKNAGTTGYVVVKHRNHLSVCTGSSIALDGSSQMQDFTLSSYVAYGTNALRNNNGTMTMWAGDANDSGSVKYQGANDDNTDIKNFILGQSNNLFNSLTFTVMEYNALDVNMDGIIKFQGANDDNTDIKNLILGHPQNIFNSLTYTISEQVAN